MKATVSFGEAYGKVLQYRTLNMEKQSGLLLGWSLSKGGSLRRDVEKEFDAVTRALEAAKREMSDAADQAGWNVTVYGPDTVGVYWSRDGIKFQAGMTLQIGALGDEEKKLFKGAVEAIMEKLGFGKGL
jgi:hypothetical protein